MSQEDESAKLFDTVDTFADQQLQELHRSVEEARDSIDGAARAIAAQLRGEEVPPAPSPISAAPPLPVDPSPQSQIPPPQPPVETARVAQKPTLQDAPDFGDIAATIATDDEWKKR